MARQNQPQRRIVLRAVRRDPIDAKLYARVIFNIAMEQYRLERKAQEQADSNRDPT